MAPQKVPVLSVTCWKSQTENCGSAFFHQLGAERARAAYWHEYLDAEIEYGDLVACDKRESEQNKLCSASLDVRDSSEGSDHFKV